MLVAKTLPRRQFLTTMVSATLVSACAPGIGSFERVQSTPIHYQSIIDVSSRIRTGELSPVELTETILARIAALNDELHSYITVMSRQARQAAMNAEREMQAGVYRGPLHGVPIGVKDLCFTAGIPTTGGHAFLADFRPDFDATVVRKLNAAGAVILGKLNLTEGAMIGYHPDFAIPVNPWDPSLTTSGSSSGSGVATAAGLCYAAIGTDTGGSIRFPSMACGVVGLKPTYGRVSRHGVLTLADSLDHVGPMARRTADAAVMFEVLAGSDDNDASTLTEPVPDMLRAIDGGIEGVRIGYDANYTDNGVDPGLTIAIERALSVLEGLGAEIITVSVPEFSPELAAAWVTICAAEAARAHAAYFPARASEYGEFFRGYLTYGASVSEQQYAAATRLRNAFTDQFIATLESVDAIACPAGGVPAPASADVGYGSVALEEVVGGSPWVKYTYPADFAGTPTLSLPCGESHQGFPYSMQLMGSRLSEPELCRIGHNYELVADWYRRYPPV